MTPWFALEVKPLHERAVADLLAAKSNDVFLPTQQCTRCWSDRKKVLHQPLFPGYVFCRVDAFRRVDVLRTPGVRSIVSFGGTHIPVPEEQIEGIRRIVASGFPVETLPLCTLGAKVRVRNGPFIGLEGILSSVREKSRLVVNLELLQRSVAVQIDRSAISPI
jgi:transcription antitermination factor NusG